MAHMLVIEDDVQFRDTLQQMLTRDGHQVTIATDGSEALLLLKTVRPELIITDILMPKMDGIEIIMELRRLGSETPIIAMSGGGRSIASDTALGSAELMGVKATLVKPFSRSELRKAISEALAATRAAVG